MSVSAHYLYAQELDYEKKINSCIKQDTVIEKELSNFTDRWKQKWSRKVSGANFSQPFLEKIIASPKKYVDYIEPLVHLSDNPTPEEQFKILFEKYYGLSIVIDPYELRFGAFLKSNKLGELKQQYHILNQCSGEVQQRIAFLLFALDELTNTITHNQETRKMVLEYLDDLERTAQRFELLNSVDFETHIERTDKGYIVIGGQNNDSYNMHPIYLLVDFGGNDEYFGSFASADRSVSVVLDISGDDLYKCDYRNDSFGSGINGGVGILFDLSGNDEHRSHGNSQGSGSNFGIGILWDKKGSDRYVAAEASQGYGNQSGIGLLLDNEGNDSYEAISNIIVREKPATFFSDAQGVGR